MWVGSVRRLWVDKDGAHWGGGISRAPSGRWEWGGENPGNRFAHPWAGVSAPVGGAGVRRAGGDVSGEAASAASGGDPRPEVDVRSCQGRHCVRSLVGGAVEGLELLAAGGLEI